MKTLKRGLLLVGCLLGAVGCGVEAPEEGALVVEEDTQEVSAQAGCIPGQTRTIKVGCCTPTLERQQNQICTNSAGSWSNSGSSYCGGSTLNCYGG
ncbi:hypothetical protein D7Y21_39475 [Corallococcus sp. AB045]|uniref:hypothetical protein n=1 Tax=Corallococcus sp. AB045 TaxID=2316719 RepID=UPI000ED48B89|nr:hypothetical protein [Corallococcus sp. AB045]RKH76045.1 hypothetical protein D7Y21_39475 [Corallococcus sp. AB045]